MEQSIVAPSSAFAFLNNYAHLQTKAHIVTETPLHIAFLSGNLAEFSRLLRVLPINDIPSYKKIECIYAAISQGLTGDLEFLLETFNLSAADIKKATGWAIDLSLPCLSVICKHTGTLNDTTGHRFGNEKTPIDYLLDHGQPQVVIQLLHEGAIEDPGRYLASSFHAILTPAFDALASYEQRCRALAHGILQSKPYLTCYLLHTHPELQTHIDVSLSEGIMRLQGMSGTLGALEPYRSNITTGKSALLTAAIKAIDKSADDDEIAAIKSSWIFQELYSPNRKESHTETSAYQPVLPNGIQEPDFLFRLIAVAMKQSINSLIGEIEEKLRNQEEPVGAMLRDTVKTLISCEWLELNSDFHLKVISLIVNALWATKHVDLILALLAKIGLSVDRIPAVLFSEKELIEMDVLRTHFLDQAGALSSKRVGKLIDLPLKRPVFDHSWHPG